MSSSDFMVRLNFSRAPSFAIGSFKILLSGEFASQPVIIFALNKREVGMVTHKPHIKLFAALHERTLLSNRRVVCYLHRVR